MYLYRAVDSEGNTLEFLLSPTRDAQAAKRFFLKALSFTADSVPQDGLAQEEAVKEPSLEEGAEAIAPTGVEVSRTMPRVIHVNTNAASPKAIAELKAAGVLPESVELKPGEIPQQPDRTRPSLHQTLEQAWDGLLFLRDSEQNTAGIRSDEHDPQGTDPGNG
jgi:transposase, IS6 family